MYEPSARSWLWNTISWKFAEFYITAKHTLSCYALFGAEIPNCVPNHGGSKLP